MDTDPHVCIASAYVRSQLRSEQSGCLIRFPLLSPHVCVSLVKLSDVDTGSPHIIRSHELIAELWTGSSCDSASSQIPAALDEEDFSEK